MNFFIGLLFLVVYWIIGYDGITFSDDVYYIQAGKRFWQGTMEVNDYHFSSRWGAYVPSGLIGFIFGYRPHLMSIVSLISYSLTLYLLAKILPRSSPSWVLVLWVCTHVYFLHFLTKVYPDGLLVLFACLVPYGSIRRKDTPILSGIILVAGLFLGFLTKETIVLLAPFPILLWCLDKRNNQINWKFYLTIICFGLLLASFYLTFFWFKIGDPLHRISSINAGHYISEFTYADKGIGSIIKRLTILPIVAFVERSYWAWIVFALPAIAIAKKTLTSPITEFSIAFLCLLVGFWFMTSTLEFYNPIYLNPRHLIIIIPILSFLIACGWGYWQKSMFWTKLMIALLLLGTVISVVLYDWKMAAFYTALAFVVKFHKFKFQKQMLILLLTFPAIFAIFYQKQLKHYEQLVSALKEEGLTSDSNSLLVTNNFLEFSKHTMYPLEPQVTQKLHGLDYLLDTANMTSERIVLLLYPYYTHAYPQEQVEIDSLKKLLSSKGYVLTDDKVSGILSKEIYLLLSTD